MASEPWWIQPGHLWILDSLLFSLLLFCSNSLSQIFQKDHPDTSAATNSIWNPYGRSMHLVFHSTYDRTMRGQVGDEFNLLASTLDQDSCCEHAGRKVQTTWLQQAWVDSQCRNRYARIQCHNFLKKIVCKNLVSFFLSVKL